MQHAETSLQPPEVSMTLFVQGHDESNWPAWQISHADSSTWTCGLQSAGCMYMQGRGSIKRPGTLALWH